MMYTKIASDKILVERSRYSLIFEVTHHVESDHICTLRKKWYDSHEQCHCTFSSYSSFFYRYVLTSTQTRIKVKKNLRGRKKKERSKISRSDHWIFSFIYSNVNFYPFSSLQNHVGWLVFSLSFLVYYFYDSRWFPSMYTHSNFSTLMPSLTKY